MEENKVNEYNGWELLDLIMNMDGAGLVITDPTLLEQELIDTGFDPTQIVPFDTEEE
jgi:hypothetical protein